MMFIMLTTLNYLVLKELSQQEEAPWPSPPPQHIQDLSMSSNLNAHQISGSSSRSNSPQQESATMRFTALHVTMIFIAILLCVVICAIPWDHFKCGTTNPTADNTTNTASSDLQHNNNNRSGSSSTSDEEEARQLGLTKSMIKSFRVVRYGVSSLREKAEEHQGGGSCWSECMICLSDFRNGQMVRILPHCNHGFHKKCIDQWLLSHTSCPICRNVLLVLNSPEKTFQAHHHHQQQQPEPERQPEQRHEDSVQPTQAVENHDEDTPAATNTPPSANHQDYHHDYQTVYTTYIVISE